MITEIMPYQDLTVDKSREAGIQNQVFAVKNGRGYTIHAVLEFTSARYWDLKDLGFDLKNVQTGKGFMIRGQRARGRMSLVGIPVCLMKDVNQEIRYSKDRLRFALAHQSDEITPETDVPDNVVLLSDWNQGA